MVTAAATPAPDRRGTATRSPASSWAGVPACSRPSTSAWPSARPSSRPTSPTSSEPRLHRRRSRPRSRRSSPGGVAGFDYTFSVPKSVSALWGVADAGTQALIVEAHHQAVAEVLDFLEREVVATRRGVAAGDGAVMQADIVGVAATAYDHWDSRLGDPQLHTHVVISNKVKTTEDGRWRSLDGRPMFEANVADLRALQRGAGRPHHPTVRDRVGAAGPGHEPQPRLGACARPRGADPRVLQPVHATSSKEKDRLIAEYDARARAPPVHGEDHQDARAQATLRDPPREGDPLAVRPHRPSGEDGREKILGRDAVDWAQAKSPPRPDRPSYSPRRRHAARRGRRGRPSPSSARSSEKRSTWKHWNLWAEASRQTMGWRFASAEDREAVVGDDRRGREAGVAHADSARAGRPARGLPASRRHEPLPAPALGRVHLRGRCSPPRTGYWPARKT